jgi:hypothetical protein
VKAIAVDNSPGGFNRMEKVTVLFLLLLIKVSIYFKKIKIPSERFLCFFSC